MFAQAARNTRSIPGAVATLGVSDRVAFLRRTYGLLGAGLGALALLSAAILVFAPNVGATMAGWMAGRWLWFCVLGAFVAVGVIAQRLALSPNSRATQLLGLGLAIGAWALFLQPILWIGVTYFGAADYQRIVGEAVIVTLAIFVGLTATVFITKKDFSFMRGALSIATFAMLGIALASWIFGFQLGMIYVALAILLMAGYILYQTSLILTQFPPQAFVAAALMLFSTVATLFYYVLILLMNANSGRRR